MEKKSMIGKSRGDHSKGQGSKSHGNKSSSYVVKDKKKEKEDHDSSKSKLNCSICDRPHWAYESPKRKSLNTMAASEQSQREGSKKEIGT